MSSSHVVLLVLLSQVDFPSASSSSSSSCEVLFSTPPPADFCPQYDFSKLDAISQIQLQDVLHKKAVFWSGCHCHTRSRSHTLMSSHSPRFCVGVQADGGGPPPALGEEGLLPGPECSTAPGAGQRPLLAVVLSARHLRPAEAVGVSGSPGRPGTTAFLVRPPSQTSRAAVTHPSPGSLSLSVCPPACPPTCASGSRTRS